MRSVSARLDARKRSQLLAFVGICAVLLMVGGLHAAPLRPLTELPVRDVLQLPMATAQALSDASKGTLRDRIEEARARQRTFERVPLPRATGVPPRARAALAETPARLVALDLGRRTRGQPPVLIADRRADTLELFPATGKLFSGYGTNSFTRTQLTLPPEYEALADPILGILNRSGFFSGLKQPTTPVRVEVVPSVPFAFIFDVTERVIYLNAVVIALLPDADHLQPPGRELSTRPPPPNMSLPPGAPGATGTDLGADRRADLAEEEEPERGHDAPPCMLGTLCISCSRTGCKDCGCSRELNSCCDQCERSNRQCSQCGTSCTESCNKCNSDCSRCNSDCGKCGNDCSRCSNDCSKCGNDCNRCSNDCSRCNNDCSRCGNDCNNCGNQCNNCNSGCNNCAVARPLMPPPLPEPVGVALFARAARDSLALMLPPLLFLWLRRRLLRRAARAPEADGGRV